MQFVLSLNGPRYGDWERIHSYCTRAGNDIIDAVLITPLLSSRRLLVLARELKEQGLTVFFDSGGFDVQKGRLRYQDLCEGLLEVYLKHDWADVYVLPDWPLSGSTQREAALRIEAMILGSLDLYRRLPASLQELAMFCVHGHNIDQLDRCLVAALEAGVPMLGFGGWTVTPRGQQRFLKSDLRKVHYIAGFLDSKRFHLFGAGSPSILPLFDWIGVTSFDSSLWIKRAAFGEIYFPFTGGLGVSEARPELSEADVRMWQAKTGHSCCYCLDFEKLRANKWYRAMHNLIVISDTIEALNYWDKERMIEIVRETSYNVAYPLFCEFRRLEQQLKLQSNDGKTIS